MKDRLLHFLDTHLGGLTTLAAVLLYLALLMGRETLGTAYWPILAVLVLALTGLGLRGLHRRENLSTRLRAAAPTLLLGAIIILALAIRLALAPQEQPAAGSDEAFFVEAAFGIIRSGSYIPNSLRFPSLLIYVELAAAVLRFVTGASANLWTWPTELVPATLYGWGRGIVTLLSAATLVPVFELGKRLYGRRAGLLAALFLALLPMHVIAGGIVAAQVPAALFTLLAGWCALYLLETGKPRWALAAGTCAGLAAATHYPAGLAVLVPLLAAFLHRPVEGAASRRLLALLTVTTATGAFVVGSPAVLAQTDRFVGGLAEAARVYFPPQGTAGTGLGYLLREGLGWGPAVLVLLGAVLILPRLRRTEVVLFSFPLAIYLALLLPRARFPLDLVLLAPYLALLAAAGADRAVSWLEPRCTDRLWVKGLPWAAAVVGAGLFVLALLFG
jgi:4-amino-4-deoxy-L-arabinose transferase-like glycosyltransferase